MTDRELQWLRRKARQGEYLPRVSLARELYRSGQGPRDVLAECFGAEFPDEFFVLAEQLPLPGHECKDFDYHAWRLAVPPDKGGPVAPGDAFDDDYPDRWVRECDPDLIPLVQLADRHTEYGGLTLCYRTTELAAGRSAVFGVDVLDPVDGVELCGTSLLAVLRDYHAAVVARLETLLDPRVADHRSALHRIEALAPQADPGPTPTREPSRGDYRSMSHLAHALYANGLGERSVVAECFGVEFPEEFFVVVDAGGHEELPGDTTNLPWELAVPPERGGPVVRPFPMTWPAERRIFTWDPDLVPLVALYGDERWDHGESAWRAAQHGDRIHCYRLSDLAAGRSTVYGVPWNRRDKDVELSVTHSGESLLDVVHEYVRARLRLDEWEVRQPSNRGAGSIDDSDVEVAREMVAEVEELQRRVADRVRRAGR